MKIRRKITFGVKEVFDERVEEKKVRDKVKFQKAEIENFVLVEGSKFSIYDNFLDFYAAKHRPTGSVWALKHEIEIGIIDHCFHDFFCPMLDPSINEYGEICYLPNKMPAVGKTYSWWEKQANNFCPERHSRLGTEIEYITFLAFLLKTMINDGWDINEAWNLVCYGRRRNNFIETTGNNEIAGFFDLFNTYKIFGSSENSRVFNIAECTSLSKFRTYLVSNVVLSRHVGWIILPKI